MSDMPQVGEALSSQKQARAADETTATGQRRRRTPRLVYSVVRGGNNTRPIAKEMEWRALRDGTWSSVPTAVSPSGRGRGPSASPGKSATDMERTWKSNFIWKATWSKLKDGPPTFRRDHRDPTQRQLVNHLRAVQPLCSKDCLFRLMHGYFKGKGVDTFAHVPPTFIILPRAEQRLEQWQGWSDFASAFEAYASREASPNLWLMKPSSLNRGIGIEVVQSVREVTKLLEGKAARASMGHGTTWILQKYIEDPLLWCGRKFDARIWVVMCDNGDVHVYAPGYLRTSSEEFRLDTTERFVHLTNYCQQVKNETGTFGQYEDGNTVSFPAWEQELGRSAAHLDCPAVACARDAVQADTPGDHKEDDDVANDEAFHNALGAQLLWGKGGLWDRMCDLIADTARALRVAKPMAGPQDGCTEFGFGDKPTMSRQHRFELLGYDFLIDESLNPWLLEVNTNPSLTYQNSWHQQLVDLMIHRLLRLVLDPVFPTAARSCADAGGTEAKKEAADNSAVADMDACEAERLRLEALSTNDAQQEQESTNQPAPRGDAESEESTVTDMAKHVTTPGTEADVSVEPPSDANGPAAAAGAGGEAPPPPPCPPPVVIPTRSELPANARVRGRWWCGQGFVRLLNIREQTPVDPPKRNGNEAEGSRTSSKRSAASKSTKSDGSLQRRPAERGSDTRRQRRMGVGSG